MGSQRQTKAVGYVRVATVDACRWTSPIQRHRDTLIEYCALSRLSLTHMIVDICDREGRTQALDLLRGGWASVLVVPSLAQLTRSVSELADLIDRYFVAESSIADLVSVADGIDTRTAEGRLALSVLLTFARLEIGREYHA